MASAPTRRRRSSPEETREQIERAAVELLEERAFRDLTIDAVMERVGNTRTVFYRHFSDIPALLHALMREAAVELDEATSTWAATPVVGEHVARENLGRLIDVYVRRGRVIRAWSEASHHNAEIGARYQRGLDALTALIASATGARVKSGQLPPFDVDETARALALMFDAYLLESFGRHPLSDPERVLGVLLAIWTRAIGVARACVPATGGCGLRGGVARRLARRQPAPLVPRSRG